MSAFFFETRPPFVKTNKRFFNNAIERKEFVSAQLKKIAAGQKILDAGCGSQQYKVLADHLQYYSQDFGGVSVDDQPGFAASNNEYEYGPLDYTGDIWDIDEEAGFFDCILCTEVLEHIPYPEQAIKEFARLLKSEGVLILTVPSNCLRHMDPFYFFSGFSDRWLCRILDEMGLDVCEIEPVGHYYRWMAVEVARTISRAGALSKLLLLPALAYFSFKKRTKASISTLCFGYHVVAKKRI